PPSPPPSTLSLHDALPICSRARPPPSTPPGARPALGRSAPGALAMTPGSPSPCGGAAAARLGGLLALGRGAPAGRLLRGGFLGRSEEHTSELQSLRHLVCR